METLLPTDEEGNVSNFVNNNKRDMVCNVPFNKHEVEYLEGSHDRTESKSQGPSKTWLINSQGRSGSSK